MSDRAPPKRAAAHDRPVSPLAQRILRLSGTSLEQIEPAAEAGPGPLDARTVLAHLADRASRAPGAAPVSTGLPARLAASYRLEAARAACGALTALNPDAGVPLLALVLRAACGSLAAAPSLNAASRGASAGSVNLGLLRGEAAPTVIAGAERMGLTDLAAALEGGAAAGADPAPTFLVQDLGSGITGGEADGPRGTSMLSVTVPEADLDTAGGGRIELALRYDPDRTDGGPARAYLAHLGRCLEDPRRLLL